MSSRAEVLTLTEEELKDLKEAEGRYVEPRLLLEAEFESYTPYMGGGFDTATWRRLEDCEAYLTGLPTAKQVLGRMRWLAKAALAGRAGIDSLRDAEWRPRVTVSVGGKRLEMGLLQALLGATPAQMEEMRGRGEERAAWRSLAILAVKPDNQLIVNNIYNVADLDLLAANGVNLALSSNRFALLALAVKRRDRRAESVEGRRILVLKWKKKVGGREVELNGGLEPLRPGSVRFMLRLLLDVGRLGRVRLKGGGSLADLRREAGDFLALLALLAPTVVGLGKGATRGFGRFKLQRYRLGKDLGGDSRAWEAASILESIENRCNEGAKECKAAYRRLLEILDNAAEELAGPTDGGLHLAPSLGLALNMDLINVVPAALQQPRAGGSFSPMSLAIESIGRASMKQSWNRCREEVGLGIHTWPLGLPRQQKFPRKCVDAQDCCRRLAKQLAEKVKAKIDCERNLKLPDTLVTGYVILKVGGPLGGMLEDVYCVACGDYIVKKSNSDVLNCLDAINNVKKDDLGEGRRQSMLIAFPVPFNRLYSTIDSIPVVVIMFPADDFRRSFFQGSNVRLYHSSTCGNPTKDDKPCLTILVDVAEASRSGGCDFTVEGWSLENPRSCGRRVRTTRDLTDPSDYLSVLKEAFNSFVTALQRPPEDEVM